MNCTGAPAYCWLLCLIYVVQLMNYISDPALNGKSPMHATYGRMYDISQFLYFHFYEPVYYKDPGKQNFPSSSEEKLGHWVGWEENIGDVLTWKILTLPDAAGNRHIIT